MFQSLENPLSVIRQHPVTGFNNVIHAQNKHTFKAPKTDLTFEFDFLIRCSGSLIKLSEILIPATIYLFIYRRWRSLISGRPDGALFRLETASTNRLLHSPFLRRSKDTHSVGLVSFHTRFHAVVLFAITMYVLIYKCRYLLNEFAIRNVRLITLIN